MSVGRIYPYFFVALPELLHSLVIHVVQQLLLHVGCAVLCDSRLDCIAEPQPWMRALVVSIAAFKVGMVVLTVSASGLVCK